MMLYIIKIGHLCKDICRLLAKKWAIAFSYVRKEAFNNYLRRWQFIKIGKNTFIASNVIFDLFRPNEFKNNKNPIIEIGDNCIITEYSQFIIHDTSLSAATKLHNKKIKKKWGKIVINNGAFIGAQCIILPGVTIHENSIIGAGSIVTKDVEANAVYAGNPAKKIMTIEEFFHKHGV